MYRAKELQRACPRSQAWLRQALAGGLAGAESQSTTSTSTRRFTAAARQRSVQQQHKPTTQLRPFSTSRRALQQGARPDAEAEAEAKLETPSPSDDIETVVREARATFGDTLPKDFLNKDEYKLYQRLYGTPLRETQPEDVGITFANRQSEDSAMPLSSLLRETGDGKLEVEFYYDANVKKYEETEGVRSADIDAGTDADAYAYGADSTDLVTERPLADAQIDYIQAKARSERQYIALTKLQRDFDAARLQAETENKLQEERGKEEEVLGLPIDEEEYVEEPYEPAEEEEEDEDDLDDDASPGERTLMRRVHPLTEVGRSRTSPRTVQLPKVGFVEPITDLLKRTDIKHVRLAAHKAFGGPDLPHSPRTVPTPTSSKGGRPRGNYPQLPVAMEAGQHRMSEIEADAYMSTVLPAVYATATSTLVEVRRRLGTSWIENLISKRDGSNPRVLDVGGGGGALAAWNTVFRSELAVLRERGMVPGRQPLNAELVRSEEEAEDAETAEFMGQIVKPRPSKPAAGRRRMERTVVVGSDELRHRLSRFLHDTTFLPRLPDLLHSAENVERHIDAPESPHPEGRGRRKTYDVIIASHLLLHKDKPHERHSIIGNLWAQLNPDGGVLIVLEKGHPRGFEAVADARQRIIDNYLEPPPQAPVADDASTPADLTTTTEAETQGKKRDPGMIVAPCTNHGKCPMYLTPGISKGRKDFCHFSQRYNRPPFLQRLLGRSHHNHEDVAFSYIAVQRGTQKAEGSVSDSANANADKIGAALQRAFGATDAPLPAPGPLVQGKAAADAAFKGFENVWSVDANAPPPPADAVVPHQLALPRTIMPPLKRHGHVILDVCTPAGQLERWTVPKSRGKQSYHDARKAQWGDLWALGGKTRVPRPVRLGRTGGDDSKKTRVIEVGLDGAGDVAAREPAGKFRNRDRPGKYKGKAKKGRRNREADAKELMKELNESSFET